MIYLKSLLNVVDNLGASIVECIKVLRHRPKGFAQIGDQITVVVKEARAPLSEHGSASKVKRRDVCRAIVVRTKAPFRRADGLTVRFDDNACVLINKNGEPLGTRVSLVVAREMKDRGFNKIVSLAPRII